MVCWGSLGAICVMTENATSRCKTAVYGVCALAAAYTAIKDVILEAWGE
jgi:hypothetical protein